jgi:general stress protein 26
MNDDISRLHGLLKDFSTAMLVTHQGTSGLHARPMAIAELEESCVLWFLTEAESGKVHEIQDDTNVSVVCQKDRSVYLALYGSATLEQDRSHIDRVWSESFKVWFPKGKDDPNIALIRIDPHHAEYWDNSGFYKVQYLVKAAGAYLTGTKPKIEEGEEHGRVQL